MSRTPMALAVLALTAAFAIPERADAADPTSRIVYSGRVEDAQGRPIGGIYPLTFAFYRNAKGGRPLWEESHFVAIDNGVYAVELGRDKPFPKRLAFDKSYLGVAITGGKEIVRERFSGEVSQVAPAPVVVPAPPVIIKPEPSTGAPPQPSKSSYADLAGFAYEAEKAKNADAVGGMSVAELRTLIKQADAGGKGQVKVTIGETKRFTDQVGGLGGQPFTLQCPPGYVVTGVRGRAAGYVDQLSLICSPLE